MDFLRTKFHVNAKYTRHPKNKNSVACLLEAWYASHLNKTTLWKGHYSAEWQNQVFICCLP